MINNSIVFSIDDHYASYLYVCLKSLLEHIQAKSFYKAYILQTKLSKENKEKILSLQKNNLEISFVDMTQFVQKYENTFFLSKHFTAETYYRFFLPQIFPDLDKILYLDADSLIMTDPAPLFKVDLQDNYLGVTHDCEIVCMSHLIGPKYSDYFTKKLGVKVENYFQAGVIIFNLKKMREDKMTPKLLSALKEVKSPKFVDQDILNIVFQDKVTFIPQNWDYTWHLPLLDKDYYKHVGLHLNKEFESAKNNPYVIHFTGNKIKPTDYPTNKEAQLFWRYAVDSPFFDFLFNQLISDQIYLFQKAQKKRWKLLKYQLFKTILVGRKKFEYTQKYNELKSHCDKFLHKKS